MQMLNEYNLNPVGVFPFHQIGNNLFLTTTLKNNNINIAVKNIIAKSSTILVAMVSQITSTLNMVFGLFMKMANQIIAREKTELSKIYKYINIGLTPKQLFMIIASVLLFNIIKELVVQWKNKNQELEELKILVKQLSTNQDLLEIHIAESESKFRIICEEIDTIHDNVVLHNKELNKMKRTVKRYTYE